MINWINDGTTVAGVFACIIAFMMYTFTSLIYNTINSKITRVDRSSNYRLAIFSLGFFFIVGFLFNIFVKIPQIILIGLLFVYSVLFILICIIYMFKINRLNNQIHTSKPYVANSQKKVKVFDVIYIIIFMLSGILAFELDSNYVQNNSVNGMSIIYSTLLFCAIYLMAACIAAGSIFQYSVVSGFKQYIIVMMGYNRDEEIKGYIISEAAEYLVLKPEGEKKPIYIPWTCIKLIKPCD